jgi:hypothetical protein
MKSGKTMGMSLENVGTPWKIHYKWSRKIIEMGDVLAMLDSQRESWLVAFGIPRVDSVDIIDIM